MQALRVLADNRQQVKALFRHPQFQAGVLDMASVAPGIAAWGLMTGVAMVKSGLGLVAVLMMSVLVFAGSSQLAALPFSPRARRCG